MFQYRDYWGLEWRALVGVNAMPQFKYNYIIHYNLRKLRGIFNLRYGRFCCGTCLSLEDAEIDHQRIDARPAARGTSKFPMRSVGSETARRIRPISISTSICIAAETQGRMTRSSSGTAMRGSPHFAHVTNIIEHLKLERVSAASGAITETR